MAKSRETFESEMVLIGPDGLPMDDDLLGSEGILCHVHRSKNGAVLVEPLIANESHHAEVRFDPSGVIKGPSQLYTMLNKKGRGYTRLQVPLEGTQTVLQGVSKAGRLVNRPHIAIPRQLYEDLLAQRHEDRIAKLVDLSLDADEFAKPEADIDAMNVEMRRSFLGDFPTLTGPEIFDRAGFAGKNKSQTVNVWRQKGRIFGVKTVKDIRYPLFQFDDAYQPLPVVRDTLKALPVSYSDWQIAFWFAAPNVWLEKRSPATVLTDEDASRVVEAARRTGEVPIG